MPFKYAMDMLMCGVGVGFDVRGAKTVTIKTDNRPGWHYTDDSALVFQLHVQ